MPDYMLLMHNDTEDQGDNSDWETYLNRLRSDGVLRGGSAIGSGICMKAGDTIPNTTNHITGYIKVEAESLEHARKLVSGNPVYEAGGTVEIRELPQTD